MKNCLTVMQNNGLSLSVPKPAAAIFYQYYDNLDDLIVQSVEYVMLLFEGDFTERVPKTLPELWKFIDEVPYWTIEKYGKKYRLMYQVYTHPEYRE